jgi:amino acid transporter
MSIVSAPSASADSAKASVLHRLVTWKSAFIVSLGGSLLVAVSLGTIAGDLGPASVFVWSFVALMGVMICLMIAEMAGMFPHKAGGTATYTYEAFKDFAPIVGAISNWGYWLGWIPVVAVNLILAAGYLKSFIPGLTTNDELYLAIAMGAGLYVLNYFGLKPGVWTSVAMALFALAPMVVIVASPVFRPALFHAAYLFPFKPLGGSWHSAASWKLIFKDMFLAVWSAYAFEAASTVIAEMKDPHKEAGKAMVAASAAGVFAFCIVPFVVLGICGATLLSSDPKIAFLPAAQAIFGHIGGVVVSIMLIAALLLGAQTAIIGSTRTIYEMSRDGLIIKQMGKLNKFNVPVGSMIWDGAVTIALLWKFGTNVPNIVAASNVGYMLVFMLVIPAFVILRYTKPDMERPFKLPSFFIPVAILLTVINWSLFFVGGAQWGASVMGPGVLIMMAFIPFYLYRRYVQDRGHPEPIVAPLFHASESSGVSESDIEFSGRHEVFHDTPEAASD